MLKNAKKLNRNQMKSVSGGVSDIYNPDPSKYDLSLCGCSCSGSVTGPSYCSKLIACAQVYTCGEDI